MTTVPPVRREIHVAADPWTAWEVFTAGIGRWWPLDDKGVHGAGATVAFAEGEIVERAPGKVPAVWGTVTRWEPAVAVELTWHPGRPAEQASTVAVTFAPSGNGTRVLLEHRGWEVYDDPAATRADYDEGWPPVLGRYAAAVQAPPT